MNEPRADGWIETMQNCQAGWVCDHPSSGLQTSSRPISVTVVALHF